MSLQVFQYQNSPITFNLDGEVMVNATQMARAFDKLPKDFLKTDHAQNFIQALASRLNVLPADIVKVMNGGLNPGTWMNQKLALKFAGWLSPEFELWVYDRIEELLTTGRTQLQPMSDEEFLAKALLISHEKAKKAEQRTLMLEQQTEQQQEVIKVMAPKADYYDKVLGSEGLYSATNVAQHFNMSAVKFNELLKELKIQRKINGMWALCAKHLDKGFTKNRPFPYMGSDGTMKTKDQMMWTPKGIEFLHTILDNLQKKSA